MVDLKKGESFTFLGLEYRRIPTFQGKWRPNYAPKLKKRTALYESLRKIFRQCVSWPVGNSLLERKRPNMESARSSGRRFLVSL